MNKSAKNEYRQLCRLEPTIPIFSKGWWLDAVCGPESWDVVLVKKGGDIIGTLPYYCTCSLGSIVIKMPQLTQALGSWIRCPENQKYANRLSFEKRIMTELIDKLPSFTYFCQNFHYSVTNWLPFYWRGFRQTTRYTYVIEDLSDLDYVFSNFDRSKRKNIARAEKKVTVQYDLSSKDFYENHKLTLFKQGQNISYSYELFSKIYDAVYANQSGKTIYSIDNEQNIHSALFVIWDECSAYDLISTIDPDFRNSGSASLLVREIIKYVSDKTGKFDFEGSMIEDVERSFRRFGAIQKPYFCISKDSRKLLIKMAAKTKRITDRLVRKLVLRR